MKVKKIVASAMSAALCLTYAAPFASIAETNNETPVVLPVPVIAADSPSSTTTTAKATTTQPASTTSAKASTAASTKASTTTATKASTSAQTTTTTTAATTTAVTTKKPAGPVPGYMLGDPTGDMSINAIDASLILTEYAQTSANHPATFSSIQKLAADVDKNGKVDAVDASNVLRYYAYSSVDGSLSLSEFLDPANQELIDNPKGTTTTTKAVTTTTTTEAQTTTTTADASTTASTNAPTTTATNAPTTTTTNAPTTTATNAPTTTTTNAPTTTATNAPTTTTTNAPTTTTTSASTTTANASTTSTANSSTTTAASTTSTATATTTASPNAPTSIKLSKTTMTINKGDKDIAQVEYVPSTVAESEKEIIWTSSDEKVATVDAKGFVTGVEAGTCTITAKSKGNSNAKAEIKVTVNAPNKVSEIKLDKTEIKINVGQKDISYVTMTPANLPESEKGEIWSSSDTKIATVDQYGWITGVAEGTCTVTVQSKNNSNVKAVIKVTVSNPNKIKNISLTKTAMSLEVGGKSDISYVTMSPSGLASSAYAEKWTSSDTKVATVDQYGNVKPVGAGTCTVTVQSVNNPDVKADIKVTVVGASNTVSAINLTENNITLNVGYSKMPIVTMLPSSLPESAKGEIWTSSDTKVATVDWLGNITAVGAGTCTVTVQSKNNTSVKAEVKVTVVDPNKVTEIQLSKTTMNLTVGGAKDISYVTMKPTTLPESSKGEKWTSSNTAVATVDQYGNVKPVGAGTCTVTVQSVNNPNVKADIKVTVTGGSTPSSSSITGISLTKEAISLETGKSGISYVTMTPSGLASSKYNEKWTSSNTAVATVNGYGWVYAVAPGTCTVTVQSEDNPNVKADIKVTVVSPSSASIAAIDLTETNVNLKVGQSKMPIVTMYPSALPESAKGENWSSSNTSVATVDWLGNITAVGAGTCTVTVQSKNNPSVKADVKVTVTGNSSQTTTSSVTGIDLSKTSMNLTVGGAKDISYVTMKPTGLNESLYGEKWTSSNTAVATVDQYGWVTPVAAGTCTVTVQSVNNPNVKADIKVTVSGASSSVTGITLTKTAMNLTVGGKADISYVTMLPTGLNESLYGEKWTSSNTAVATVDQYGWVTPVAAGTCTVTVQSVNNPNVKADIKVTVSNPAAPTVSAISLSKTSMNLYVGDYADISYVTMLPATLPESVKGEIWSSSNTAVAVVDGYGWVTPVAPGTCTVTVKSANNPSVSANITVYVYQKKN